VTQKRLNSDESDDGGPIKRIPIAEPCLGAAELDNVTKAVESGWISSAGSFVAEFEEAFSRYCGVEFGVATSSGTTALHLALVALGIHEDHEVLVPSLTFAATANAVVYTGAKPVFVDSHSDYWCLDPEKLEDAVTGRTRAVIPVHLYGHPCDMDAILSIAEKHGLLVIEDAAEAHGADYKGRKAGSFGRISCFSFYGNKIITTGEGGMCLTSDVAVAERMRILRDHGMAPNRRYWHDMVGFNYRMTNLQAAIGVAQVARLDEFLVQKRSIWQYYSANLADLEEDGLLALPHPQPWAAQSYWLYTVLIRGGIGRDELIKSLANRGIETRPAFQPLHLMSPYGGGQVLPIAEELARTGLSLPSSIQLSEEELAVVVDGLRSLLY